MLFVSKPEKPASSCNVPVMISLSKRFIHGHHLQLHPRPRSFERAASGSVSRGSALSTRNHEEGQERTGTGFPCRV